MVIMDRCGKYDQTIIGAAARVMVSHINHRLKMLYNTVTGDIITNRANAGAVRDLEARVLTMDQEIADLETQNARLIGEVR